jgi:hypothetical protein
MKKSDKKRHKNISFLHKNALKLLFQCSFCAIFYISCKKTLHRDLYVKLRSKIHAAFKI